MLYLKVSSGHKIHFILSLYIIKKSFIGLKWTCQMIPPRSFAETRRMNKTNNSKPINKISQVFSPTPSIIKKVQAVSMKMGLKICTPTNKNSWSFLKFLLTCQNFTKFTFTMLHANRNWRKQYRCWSKNKLKPWGSPTTRTIFPSRKWLI